MTLATPLQFLVLLLGSWISRRQGDAIEYLRAENRVLRARLGRKRLRFTDPERRLLAEKGKPLGRRLLAEIASLATPETILRWHREKVAAKYDGSQRRRAGSGAPARAHKVQQLLTMARENPSWGYTRLRGALDNLGLHLGRSTIQRILKEHGIEPAPLRGKTMPWKTFLKAHWGAIAAADFFSVEVLTVGGLARYLVLFVMDLKTRRVHVAGVTCRADGAWMAQVARNLIDARTWSSEEVGRLYTAANAIAPGLVAMLHFLLDTGCRKGEALAAEWSWVHWKSRQLRIPVTDYWRPKDKDAREVPLSDALLETLRSLPKRSEQYIFPNVYGLRYRTFPEKLFRKIASSAKLLGGPHTTRHTYASHFLQSQPDLPLLANVLGHSQLRVTELYTHLLPDHLDRARNAVQLGPAQKPWRNTMADPVGPPFLSGESYSRH